jgi:hypothetical protein
MAVRRKRRSNSGIDEAQRRLYSNSLNGVVAKESMRSDRVGARAQTLHNKRGSIGDHQQSGLYDFASGATVAVLRLALS